MRPTTARDHVMVGTHYIVFLCIDKYTQFVLSIIHIYIYIYRYLYRPIDVFFSSDPVAPLVAGVSQTNHANVMMSVGARTSNLERREELLPCCTASRMSGISLIYRDENGGVVKSDLPNMKVETCGCA